MISKHSLAIRDLLCVFFHYYTCFKEEEEEEEEEEEDITQRTLGTSDSERKWVPEINSDSCLSLPTTSAIPEQDKRDSGN